MLSKQIPNQVTIDAKKILIFKNNLKLKNGSINIRKSWNSKSIKLTLESHKPKLILNDFPIFFYIQS